jgi:catechol 2,3-dioxygenase-like lactoylglutathione lyase family enzyme
MQLSMTLIIAKDMDRMIAFYRDGIGLRFLEAESSDGWAVFDAGGARLALHRIPEHIAKNILIATPPIARGETPIKLFFRASGALDAARAHLVASGAVMFDPHDGRCDGLDPEGNVFSIVT